MGWGLIGLEVNPSFIKFTKRGVEPHFLVKKIFELYGLEQGWDYHISQSDRPGQDSYTIVIPRKYALHFKLCFDDVLDLAFSNIQREELIERRRYSSWSSRLTKSQLEQDCVRDLVKGDL